MLGDQNKVYEIGKKAKIEFTARRVWKSFRIFVTKDRCPHFLKTLASLLVLAWKQTNKLKKIFCPCWADLKWLFCRNSLSQHWLTVASATIWSPRGVHLHLSLICIKPSAVLQCYWTNQPYRLLESGALPNYNLSGSWDADECEGITVQSHTRHWHSASDSSTRPPNPAPRVTLRRGRSWFQVPWFVSL